MFDPQHANGTAADRGHSAAGAFAIGRHDFEDISKKKSTRALGVPDT
jgi:hypothetical protein